MSYVDVFSDSNLQHIVFFLPSGVCIVYENNIYLFAYTNIWYTHMYTYKNELLFGYYFLTYFSIRNNFET